MTALAEIREAVRKAPRVKRGWAREIWLGPAAWLAVNAQLTLLSGKKNLIEGVPVAPTTEFPGWALVEYDTAGIWHFVGAAA